MGQKLPGFKENQEGVEERVEEHEEEGVLVELTAERDEVRVRVVVGLSQAFEPDVE